MLSWGFVRTFRHVYMYPHVRKSWFSYTHTPLAHRSSGGLGNSVCVCVCVCVCVRVRELKCSGTYGGWLSSQISESTTGRSDPEPKPRGPPHTFTAVQRTEDSLNALLLPHPRCPRRAQLRASSESLRVRLIPRTKPEHRRQRPSISPHNAITPSRCREN